MKEIYADFNDFLADGSLPLTCIGSKESIASLETTLVNGEEVLLYDGELTVIARVYRLANGTWEGRGDWKFFGN